MLFELWDYFTTPVKNEFKKEGMLYPSIALSHRARRCEKYWADHLQNCHQLISAICKNQKGHVVVLGSGLLLETPIDLLLKYFQKISFVDVVHPKEIRLLVKNYPQVQLIESNVIDDFVGEGFDFVISANLLSQLGLIQAQKLKEIGYSEDYINQIIGEIQTDHIKTVLNCAPTGLLFSDFQMQLIDKDGIISHQEETLVMDLNLQWEKTWNWNLAPIPEYSKTYSMVLEVGALVF